MGDDGGVKRSTAVRHLVEVAEEASDRLRFRDTSIGWPLEELWAAGSFVEPGESGEGGAVVLLLDVPAPELSWLRLHPAGEYVGEVLRLGKRPVSWWYRPVGLPAWSVEHRRVVRFWTAAGGLDERVIDGLRRGDLEGVDVVEPGEAELLAQLREELAMAREHLRTVLDCYWDRDWHRGHRPPEDHLGRAAEAVSSLERAVSGADAPH